MGTGEWRIAAVGSRLPFSAPGSVVASAFGRGPHRGSATHGRPFFAQTPRQGRIRSPAAVSFNPTAVSLSAQPAWFAASAATTPSLEPQPSASTRTAVSLSFGRKKEKVRRKEKESPGLRIRRKRRRRPHLRCGKAPSYFAYRGNQLSPRMPTGRPCTFIGRVWFPTLRVFLKRCMPP